MAGTGIRGLKADPVIHRATDGKTMRGLIPVFWKAMVKRVGTKYKLDSRRLYVGGISSAATMTNRALLFRSDFWAGGMQISGEW
jgi:poly(3-hydroxybutyrate) depolymerase